MRMISTALLSCGLLSACGSQAHSDHNRAQIDAQLNAADALMPDGAGASTPQLTLGPSAAEVGGQMRAAAAHPPAVR